MTTQVFCFPMRRYSLGFLIVALFCFLFPFTVITPASNAGVLPLTGWDMLFPQNIAVSKQPPIILNVPLRWPMLFAVICGAVAALLKLARRNETAVIVATATSLATIALFTLTTSSPLVQLTDGNTVLHVFESPAAQLLPAFYISLVLMCAAGVTSWMNLHKRPIAGVGIPSAAGLAGRNAPATKPVPGVALNSFCIKCGDALLASARFCNRCGAAVAKVPLAPSVPAVKPLDVVSQVPGKSVATPVVTTVAAATSPAPTFVAPVVVLPAASQAPEVVSRPVSQPAPVPSRVIVPPAPLAAAPKRGLSPGAKLGLAAASVIVVAAVWLAFHNSAGTSASVSAPMDISLYPATVRVSPGESVRLQAMVTGGIDREVQWSIQEGSPGGTVEAAGATVQNGNVFLTANYKAPYLTGTYHVIVVSTADQTRKAVAQVIVGYSWLRR